MPLYTLVIHFTNGSTDFLPFSSYLSVRDYYQHRISYSGGKVRRVEVDMKNDGGGIRAIWDISWSDYSKFKGLQA